jgi:type III secretion protein U
MADTEERNLPPTGAKLRRARKEGKVAHSRDLVALAMLPVLLWLVFNWRGFETDLKAVMLAAFAQDLTIEPDYLVRVLAPMILNMIITVALPMLVLGVVIGLVLSVIDTQGFVFSAKPLAPDFNRINPGQGLKRIFSARTMTEAGFNLVKLMLFAGVAALILSAAMPQLRRLQVCGLPCLPQTLSATVLPLIVAAVAVFIVAALIDFILSRNLFRLEMRMSMTEMKHENKDTYGSPEQKRHRRDEGRRMMSGPKRLGVSAATLMIEAQDGIVGVRYAPAEVRAPVIVSKSRDAAARDHRAVAEAEGISIVANVALGNRLLERGTLGAIIPPETFTDVANEIVKAERAKQSRN